MKKLLFAALLAVSLTASAFASPANEVSYRVSNAFVSSFPKASNIQWQITENYTKATFLLNNVNTEAFYSPTGDFIGTSQAISIDELPTAVKRNFAKKYGAYTVKEAIRFNGAEEFAYYISAENEKHSVILKAVDATIETVKISGKK